MCKICFVILILSINGLYAAGKEVNIFLPSPNIIGKNITTKLCLFESENKNHGHKNDIDEICLSVNSKFEISGITVFFNEGVKFQDVEHQINKKYAKYSQKIFAKTNKFRLWKIENKFAMQLSINESKVQLIYTSLTKGAHSIKRTKINSTIQLCQKSKLSI